MPLSQPQTSLNGRCRVCIRSFHNQMQRRLAAAVSCWHRLFSPVDVLWRHTAPRSRGGWKMQERGEGDVTVARLRIPSLHRLWDYRRRRHQVGGLPNVMVMMMRNCASSQPIYYGRGVTTCIEIGPLIYLSSSQQTDNIDNHFSTVYVTFLNILEAEITRCQKKIYLINCVARELFFCLPLQNKNRETERRKNERGRKKKQYRENERSR